MNLKVCCMILKISSTFFCAETSYIHKNFFFKFAHCSIMMQVQLFLLTQYKQQIKKEGMINSCYFYGKGRRIRNAIFRIMNYVCSLPWKHKSWLVYLKRLLIVRVFFFLSREWRFSVFKTYMRIFNFSCWGLLIVWWTEGEFGKNTLFFLLFQFNNLKLQTSNLANHHLDVIKQLKELQFRILDQELNRWKREQQLSGNGAPFHNNLDTIQKWCEDLALIIWNNMQQIRQLAMIQESLNIPSQELTMNILPELSDGFTMLLDALVKSSFVIGKISISRKFHAKKEC